MITGKNIIGFDYSAEGNNTFHTYDPAANKANPWLFYECSLDELDRAVRLAHSAWLPFRKTSGTNRADFINAVADELIALGDDLVRVYTRESGLPVPRAIGERNRTVNQLRAFAQLLIDGSWVNASIDTADPDRRPVPKPDIRKMMIPIGPIAVFGSSNFPLAYSTAGGDTASALAAGCPVIVKSHPMHTGTGELVAGAIIKAARSTDMPEGVFSNLNTAGIEIGRQLVMHPLIKGVGFTGSIAGGRAIMDLAAGREKPIPVFAEMGSTNPVAILPSALKNKSERWAKEYAASICQGMGQFCTKPGLIFGIDSESFSAFAQQLTAAINEVTSGTMLHPGIAGKFVSRKTSVLSTAGVTPLVSGEQVDKTTLSPALASISGEAFIAAPQTHEEVFGPFSLIVSCKNFEELVQAVSCLKGQLTASILSEDHTGKEFMPLLPVLEEKVGRIIFNGVPTGVEVCPSMVHGGPYPASSDARFTAVGIHSIQRWVRPIAFQNFPDNALPFELKNDNPNNINRLINNQSSNKTL